MTVYEYLCKDCGEMFERRRSMADAEGEVRCPAGHASIRRRFSVHAMSGGGSAQAAPEASGGGGGCCGGGCGCR